MELEYDFQVIEDMLRQSGLIGTESFSFQELVKALMAGNLDQVVSTLKERISSLIFQ